MFPRIHIGVIAQNAWILNSLELYLNAEMAPYCRLSQAADQVT